MSAIVLDPIQLQPQLELDDQQPPPYFTVINQPESGKISRFELLI